MCTFLSKPQIIYPLQLYVIRDSHCIHVDPKASETTKKAIAAIVECYKYKYPNTSIFTAADPVPVYWGYFSVLEVRLLNLCRSKTMFGKIREPNHQADLICMRQLLLRNKEWDFYVNLASSELPLMVMGEIEELVV